MIDMEQQAVGYVLSNPSSYHVHEFSSEWFTDKRYKQTAEAIESLDGEFGDFSELVLEAKKRHPFTEVTAEWLSQEQYAAFKVGDFQQLTQSLKRMHYKRAFDLATNQYIKTPSEANRRKVMAANQRLEDTEGQDDDGSMDEATDLIEWQLENDRPDVVKTYKNLNWIIGGGIEPGRIITIGARPGSGKTAYALNLALQALRYNKNAYIDLFSLEMTKELIMKRLLSRMGNIDINKTKNMKALLTQDEKRAVIKHNKYIKQSTFKIYDSLFSVDEIVRAVHKRNALVEDGSHVVIIDYLQLMDSNGTFQSRQVEIGKITKKLKRLANTENISIILLSQLSRNSETREKPILSDLRESGDIEQDSDIVLLMHEDPEQDGHIFVEVAKNRDGGSGTMEYSFVKSKMTFDELDTRRAKE